MKYKLQKSEKPNHWVLTDEKNLITIIFEEGKFNETQKVQMLNTPNLKNTDMGALAVNLAKIMRKAGEWLQENHPHIHSYIEPNPTDKIKAIMERLGMNARVASEAVGLSYSAFRSYLPNNTFQDYHLDRLKEFIYKVTDEIEEGKL